MFKKIALIVAAVVGLGIILSLFVPKTFSTEFDQEKIMEINIYKNGEIVKTLFPVDETKEKYDTLLDSLNDSFKTTLAYATLKGKLFASTEIAYEKISTVYSNALLNNTEKTILQINYSEEQEIKFKGKTFTDSVNFPNAESIKYKYVLIEVKDSSSLNEIKIYLVNNSNASYYHYVAYGVQNKLHSTVLDLI